MKFKLKFKVKFNPFPYKGIYFYCLNGEELWHWNKIIKVDTKENRMLTTWLCNNNTEVADPLDMDLKVWMKDVYSGDWKIAEETDTRIPQLLKDYKC
jgi:hypothetical protein